MSEVVATSTERGGWMRGNPAVTHERALEAAVSLAAEAGLAAVTASSVAAHLGVRERLVRALWSSDETLVTMTFVRIVEDEVGDAEREVLAAGSPSEQLSVLLRTLAEPDARLDGVWVSAWSLGRRMPALADAVRRQEAAWHALIEAVVRRGVQDGTFAAADADEVATHLLAMINGVNAYSLVGYRSEVDRLRMLHAMVKQYLAVDLPVHDG
jgi:AcrR family transcriptional regulator